MADFCSIGTNDFVQYMLAVDRYSESVGHLYSPFHPGVIRALHDVAQSCAVLNFDVSVCGEMASLPSGALALAALGFRKLSMAPTSVRTTRFILANADQGQLDGLRQEILAARRGSEVRGILDAFLGNIDPRLPSA